jgi:hypothetical protein
MYYSIMLGRRVDDVPTEWDSTHFCKPSALTPEEAQAFGVTLVPPVAQPAYDPATQSCTDVGAITQVWRIDPLPQDQAAINLQANVQMMMDSTVRARHYDSLLSACSYVGSANATFAAEAKACVAWRDAVWSSCDALLAQVEAGSKPVPTSAELLASLPALTWP